ncbi:MAG: hypothetical protein PHX62_00090 [Bacilli bacterium]|nr:hypothetical protein [Bacilli bacterium]
MGTSVMQSAKWCANCAYWGGERKLEGFFGRAEIEDFHVKGQCANVKGYYLQQCPYNGTCPHFTKHPVIKN